MSLPPTAEQTPGSPASPGRQPTLRIISHNRFEKPEPDLVYDVRQVPNPPRDARTLHTGLSRNVQEDLRGDERYRDMVDMAESQIREEMGRRIERAEAGGGGSGPSVLSVGCMCGSGHHRSVAMAEELRRREWPENWRVEVSHCDVTAEVRDRKSMTREQMRRLGEEVEGG